MFCRNKKQKVLIFTVITALLVLIFAGTQMEYSTDSSGSDIIINNDEVVALIRKGLREHSAQITVTFENPAFLSDCSQLAFEWMEAAMEETEEASEGDYIRYQCGGYETDWNCENFGSIYKYTVKITPKYYMYLIHEEEVTKKLDEIFKELDFEPATSDYEKISKIYDYICSNVTYDKVHRKNPYYVMRSTAYAALIQKNATCQGYCVALYRMLRQAGINTRIVTGEGYGEKDLHAWNIVELDGKYYNLDATWDAGKEEYEYFLKGSVDFLNHTPGEEFLTEVFCENYPMAERDYGY